MRPELRRLDIAETKKVYELYMKKDFPRNERKPFRIIADCMRRGCYEVYGAFLDGELTGYALFYVTEKDGRRIALLDYFAVVSGRRGQGLGSAILEQLTPERLGLRCFVLESEQVTEGLDNDTREVREKRFRFYERAGGLHSGVQAYLYGVNYDIIVFQAEGVDLDDHEIFAVTDYLYREMYPLSWFPRLAKVYDLRK